MTPMKRIFAICLLSLVGLIDSLLIGILHLTQSKLCTSSCQVVLASKWSTIAGIPVAILGIGFYASLFYLGIRLYQKDKSAWPVLTIMTFLAFLFSIALFGIQAFDIVAFCPYCLISFAVVMLLFILVFSYHHKNEGSDLLEFIPSFQNHGIPIIIAFSLPIFIVLGLNLSKAESPIVAKLGDKEYRLEVIDSGLGLSKIKHDETLNTMREEWLNRQVLLEEATAQNITHEELYKKEILDKISVTPEEIQQFYTLNAHVFPDGFTPDTQSRIQRHLAGQSQQKVINAYLKSLHKKYNVVISLPKPQPLDIPKSTRPSPLYGSPEAKQTVVIFSDFECPFCKQVHLDINQALKRNPMAFNVEYRFLPLSIHRYAKKAAVAAVCANQQDQFVTYAGILYDNQKSLEPKNLFKYAEQIGLNMAQFKQCFENPETTKYIESEAETAESLNIVGTPALFLNGYPLKALPE